LVISQVKSIVKQVMLENFKTYLWNLIDILLLLGTSRTWLFAHKMSHNSHGRKAWKYSNCDG
jgi:hypothetical protein